MWLDMYLGPLTSIIQFYQIAKEANTTKDGAYAKCHSSHKYFNFAQFTEICHMHNPTNIAIT